MIILENGMEIFFGYHNNLCLKDWCCSWIHVNEPKYFYFSLTLFGGSVTMQRKIKVKV
jgi:hypothetical protein